MIKRRKNKSWGIVTWLCITGLFLGVLALWGQGVDVHHYSMKSTEPPVKALDPVDAALKVCVMLAGVKTLLEIVDKILHWRKKG